LPIKSRVKNQRLRAGCSNAICPVGGAARSRSWAKKKAKKPEAAAGHSGLSLVLEETHNVFREGGFPDIERRKWSVSPTPKDKSGIQVRELDYDLFLERKRGGLRVMLSTTRRYEREKTKCLGKKKGG